jgi:hypothetical protein
MPDALTHVRAALVLLPVIQPAAPFAFLAGNLAPDAAIAQPDGTTQPPKALTHFKQPGQRPFALADWAFYRQFVLGRDHDPEAQSFLLGYFCHLLTDNAWVQVAGKTLVRDRFAPVEAYFLATQRLSLPDAVPLSIPPEIAAFLPADLIEAQIAAVLQRLTLTPALPDPPAPPEAVERVDDFLAALPELIGRVMGRLAAGDFPAEDAISTLS